VRLALALIGSRSRDLRGHNRNPRPASPVSTYRSRNRSPPLELSTGRRGSRHRHDGTTLTRPMPTRFPPHRRSGSSPGRHRRTGLVRRARKGPGRNSWAARRGPAAAQEDAAWGTSGPCAARAGRCPGRRERNRARKDENPRGRELGTPTGVTGRVGPVRTTEPPPRRGSGLITATESATPQAVSQSPVKTSPTSRMVAAL
jgi:hypothetical protein